jgi:hypothetical protein
VDLNVTLYATIESFFTRLGQKEFIESSVLTNSMQTLGYAVRILPPLLVGRHTLCCAPECHEPCADLG